MTWGQEGLSQWGVGWGEVGEKGVDGGAGHGSLEQELDAALGLHLGRGEGAIKRDGVEPPSISPSFTIHSRFQAPLW